MPQFDRIEFIRNRLAAHHGPDDGEKLSLPEMLCGRAPTDRVWALAMFELLSEIDRLRAAAPATSPAPATAPGTFSCVQFKAELSAAEYAEALTAALAGDASMLIAAFKGVAPYHDAIRAQRGGSALADAYRRRAMRRSSSASLEEQTR